MKKSSARKRMLLLALLLMSCSMITLLSTTKAYAKEIITIVVDADTTGKTDASKIIQKALDVARKPASNTTYKIILPPGTYSIQTGLKIYSNTHLYMKGATLKREFSGSIMRFGRESDIPSTGYKGYNGFCDIVIEGGVFDGNAEKNPKYNASLLRFAHAKNITIKDVTFQDVRKSHHVEAAAVNNLKVTGCTFKDYHGTEDSNNEALQLDIMHTEKHFPKYGSYDDTISQNVVIENNKFINLQRGVGTHSGVSGSYFTNIKIRRNTFENIQGYAIIATNYKKSEISNNVMTNVGAGIRFRTMDPTYNTFYISKNNYKINGDMKSKITNNQIVVTDKGYKTTAFGISVYGEDLRKVSTKLKSKKDYRIKNVEVAGNTITMKNRGYGIWLQGAQKIKVNSNKVIIAIPKTARGGGNGDGIRLIQSTDITISKNTIVGKTNNSKSKEQCGIVLNTNSKAVISGNIINNSNKDGIYLFAGCSAEIKGNKINNSKRDGIFLNRNCSATITKNTISKTVRHGINAGGSSKVKQKSNKFIKIGKKKVQVL